MQQAEIGPDAVVAIDRIKRGKVFDPNVQPELFFRNIVSFLGWPVFEDQLAQSIGKARFDRLQAFENQHGFHESPDTNTRGFFRFGESNRWRSVLSRSQIDRVISTHGTMMKRLGYLDPIREQPY